MVQGCTRTKQAFWREDQFVVTASSGVRDRDKRVAEIVVREQEKVKPDSGDVRTRKFVTRFTRFSLEIGNLFIFSFG